MSKPKFTLGQCVHYRATIHRRSDFSPLPDGREAYHRLWRRREVLYSKPYQIMGEGVLVGTRVFKSGYMLYPVKERGLEHFGGFVTTESHRVAVIAFALHRKPVYAFLEDVEAVDDE